MKKFKSTFKIVLVAIALSGTAYSQSVRSAYFSGGQLGNDGKRIVRAFKPGNMLVVSSFSVEDRTTKFAFFKKNSTVVKYMELPYDYTVNDFVILDSCIYFCGQTDSFRNTGYIGMSAISTSLQGANTYCLLVIDSAATLTKLVAYKEETSSSVGITAIGTPKDTNYTSCIVDVNKHGNPNSSWKYWYGHIAGEEITDICDASTDLLATVGKPKSPNNGSGIYAVSPALLLRTYKKDDVLAEGMSNIVHKYSNYIYPYDGGGFLVEKVDDYNIAVVGSSSTKFLSTYYPITISKISIGTFIMNNTQRITYDSTRSRNLVDLEYFPTTNQLGILTNVPNTMGELLFTNMAKTSAYTSSRLRRTDNLFNSITESNNGYFEIICTQLMTMTESVSVLYENISIFKESNCSTDASMPVSAKSVYTGATTQNKSFVKHNKEANWIYISTNLHETTATIHCANYYK